MRIKPTNLCLAILIGLASPRSSAAADTSSADEKKASLKSGQSDAAAEDKKIGSVSSDFGDLPTFIKSDSLSLKSSERLFVYSGNVEVKQGDMTLTSDELEGYYDENNKIQRLIAKKNVVITKGDEIKATGQKGVYEAASETVTLTEGPELQQKESVLTADVIRIFLDEDRSTAEGDVRVKLVNKSEGKPGRSNLLEKDR